MYGHMMALGGYIFMVDTAAYQKLQRADEQRWVTMERLRLEPIQQWVGFGIVTIDLSGTIYPHFSRAGNIAGTYQIERMREWSNLATPLPLVDGRGNYFGLFTIKNIEENATDVIDMADLGSRHSP